MLTMPKVVVTLEDTVKQYAYPLAAAGPALTTYVRRQNGFPAYQDFNFLTLA